MLERFHVRATFFVIGKMLRYFSASTVREIRDGDVIGDHTETHPMMATLSAHDQHEELFEQIARIELLDGPRPALFRPPYGSFNATTLRELHAMHLLMVLWSVDTDDYQQPGVAAIVQRALAGAHPGAIILMHDAGGMRTQTIAALPMIIDELREARLSPRDRAAAAERRPARARASRSRRTSAATDAGRGSRAPACASCRRPGEDGCRALGDRAAQARRLARRASRRRRGPRARRRAAPAGARRCRGAAPRLERRGGPACACATAAASSRRSTPARTGRPGDARGPDPDVPRDRRAARRRAVPRLYVPPRSSPNRCRRSRAPAGTR